MTLADLVADPQTIASAIGGLIGGGVGGAIAAWRAVRGAWRRDVRHVVREELGKHVLDCPLRAGGQRS